MRRKTSLTLSTGRVATYETGHSRPYCSWIMDREYLGEEELVSWYANGPREYTKEEIDEISEFSENAMADNYRDEMEGYDDDRDSM